MHLNYPETISNPTAPQFKEKLSSTKPVPGAIKAGDRWYRLWSLGFVLQEMRVPEVLESGEQDLHFDTSVSLQTKALDIQALDLSKGPDALVCPIHWCLFSKIHPQHEGRAFGNGTQKTRNITNY